MMAKINGELDPNHSETKAVCASCAERHHRHHHCLKYIAGTVLKLCLVTGQSHTHTMVQASSFHEGELQGRFPPISKQ